MFRLLSISFVLALISGCSTVATMTGNDSQSLNKQAQKAYIQVVGEAQKSGKLDTTSTTAKRVHSIFDRLIPVANTENHTGIAFNWQMSVVRSDEMNAWAMPGGKMMVYTGIVERLKLTDAETAAIIGHEMAHALLEHSKKDAGQKVITGVLTGVASVALSIALQTDMSSLGSLAADLGVDKPFSRKQEDEADILGMMIMARAGYNPNAAVSVWQKMNQVSGNQGLGSIFSTHPSNNTRIESLRKNLPSAMQAYQNSTKQL